MSKDDLIKKAEAAVSGLHLDMSDSQAASFSRMLEESMVDLAKHRLESAILEAKFGTPPAPKRDPKFVSHEADCPACKERGKTWRGSDPKCAFRFGVFSSDNWNCATLSDLRVLAEQLQDRVCSWGYSVTYNYRHGDDSIAVLPCPEDCKQMGFVVLSWYKQRGAVDSAHVLECGRVENITLDTAQAVIKYCNRLFDNYKKSQQENAPICECGKTSVFVNADAYVCVDCKKWVARNGG